ncbi:unnamed protein product, partial [marine sediment metagenome]
ARDFVELLCRVDDFTAALAALVFPRYSVPSLAE